MKGKPLQVLGTLVGDIVQEQGARTKYGRLFALLQQRLHRLAVYDATLRGAARWFNALRVLHPDRRRWRERFYQNVPAFRARSQQVRTYLDAVQGQYDVVLQVGVLFHTGATRAAPPTVIYTDYTMALSARKPAAGRAPLSPRQVTQWFALERQAYEHAAHICTRGNFVRDSIISDYDISPARVTAIGGGVNFDALPAKSLATPRQPTALFIGKDFYRKGGDRLLSAFAQVRATLGDARLLLLTADPIPAEFPRAGVEVIAPTWDRQHIARLYRAADVFVLPSRLETWGDVLLEAMAFGLPCIAVVGDAMEEIIDAGRTGLVVPVDDPAALARAMLNLLENPPLRQQMGEAARQKVASMYTWESVVERLLPVLQAAAASGTIPPRPYVGF